MSVVPFPITHFADAEEATAMAASASPMAVSTFTFMASPPRTRKPNDHTTMISPRRGGAPYAPYLPKVARREPLVSVSGPCTRDA